jgi:hypothetical protein
VGTVAIGAGIIAAAGTAYVAVVSTATLIAIGVATAAVTHLVIKELMPDVATNVKSNQDMTVGKPVPRIVVGETVISGSIIKYDKQKIDKKEWNLFYLALVPHPCESVLLYQLEGKRTTAMLGEGYYMEARLGDQTGPTSRSLQTMTNVDGTFIGTNATDVYCEFVVDGKIWPNGIQDLKFKVRGIRCYDPRKDDTAGGSGTHRINDETTWEWTDNAALINFWWKRFNNSVSYSDEMFDMANIAYEANICDEVVTYTDSNGVQRTEKRYTCNGAFDSTVGHESIESELLKSCGGRWIENAGGGQFRLQVAAYRGPAIFTITEAHLASPPRRTPHTSLTDKINTINASIVDKNRFYQDADITPVVSTNLIDNRDEGVEYEDDEQLLFTQTESMGQRLMVIKLLRNAAGDSVELVLKRCYANFVAGSVVYLNMPEHLLVGNYEIEKSDLNSSNGQLSLTINETSAEMYNQAQTPPDYDATPNFQIDNTYVDPVETLAYTPTPESSFRLGVLTWDHPSSDSVVRYVVTIEENGEVVRSDETIERYYNITNLPVGNYTALVYAVNTFGKPSDVISRTFSTEVPSTPTGQIGIQVLPGRVIITGPTLPNSSSTYEWRYYFSDSFENAFEGGLNKVLTVTNTPSGGTLYVWYRIVDGDLIDPGWVPFAVPNLVGISADEVTPELIGGLTLPGLPQTLLDTISGVTSDIDNWSQQTGELGGDYSTLLYNVTEATGAAAANTLDIIAIKELVGTTSVTAQITEFKNVQIGYEDPQTGDWIEGAAFAQAFDEVRITDADENELSIHQYFQALETRTGELEGKVQLGVTVEGSYTGIEILAGTSGLSSFRLFMDELVFASRAGEIAYEYLAAYGRHVWYGATCNIGATKMEIKDLDQPFGPDNLVYWFGDTLLNMGVPDFDNLTKANADEWRASDGEWYRKGKTTFEAPELDIVDRNGDPLIEYDSVADTIKNYGTFYAANIIGGLYGSINKTVTQPANAVTTTHQVFLTVTAVGQIAGGTFDRILKSEPLRLTWTSPNNVDTATFVVDVLVDGIVVATASQFVTSPSGADMAVTFSIPAFLVDVPAKTTDTSIEFRISSTAATAGPTTITGQADGGVVNLSVFKTDGSLS